MIKNYNLDDIYLCHNKKGDRCVKKRFFTSFFCILLLGVAISSAETVVLPRNVLSIEDRAYFGNSSLDKVVLPDSIKRIGAYCFANSSLVSINIPQSVEFIGEKAFDNIPGLSIYGTLNSYAEQYCNDNDLFLIDDPDKIGNKYYVRFYDNDDKTISSIKYNYGDPLIVPSVTQQIFLNETYSKYFHGWDLNNTLVDLPKYVRNDYNFYAYYQTKQTEYTPYTFSDKYSFNALFPSDWTVSRVSDGSRYTNTYSNDDFKIKSVVYTIKFGSSIAASRHSQEMLSGYSTTGSDTNANGIFYNYGIKGNKTSGYSKRVLIQVYRKTLDYAYLYIDASEMTENQLAWYDYIVSTISDKKAVQ